MEFKFNIPIGDPHGIQFAFDSLKAKGVKFTIKIHEGENCFCLDDDNAALFVKISQ